MKKDTKSFVGAQVGLTWILCTCMVAVGTLTGAAPIAWGQDSTPPSLTSSNKKLEEGFRWAMSKVPVYVQTGKTGLINKDEGHPKGTGTAAYIPSYWAGYYHRTAFYGRDFAHQSASAHIAGLDEENYAMLKTFAKSATPGRNWYALWAFNFDGTPHQIDYHGDNHFVREIPAQFELLETANKLFLWTGDNRFNTDKDFLHFYEKTMTEFIDLHDTVNPNGIPEGKGDIWVGSCTYNEHDVHPLEAGDAIGAQYQATLAYAGIQNARGEKKKSAEYAAKAKELKRYFNEEWSVIDPKNPQGRYVCMIAKDGRKLDQYNKGTSYHMPRKLLTESGPRTDRYLDFISEKVGTSLNSTPDANNNIEAYTYLPDLFFLYNRNEQAWYWMHYILSVREKPHHVRKQGTNGDYPEVSFTFLSHTVEGLMGVEPNAPMHAVATGAHLPKAIKWVDLRSLSMGAHRLDIRHDGLTQTTVKNNSTKPLQWEARFYGQHDKISVGKKVMTTKHKKVNGVPVSYLVVDVRPNKSVTVHVVK